MIHMAIVTFSVSATQEVKVMRIWWPAWSPSSWSWSDKEMCYSLPTRQCYAAFWLTFWMNLQVSVTCSQTLLVWKAYGEVLILPTLCAARYEF